MEQPTKEELKKLFLIFAKMGCITFGGGYAIPPVIDREIIKKHGWITSEELLQYYSIAQITPGIIAINVSTFIGYKKHGVIGGIVATLGFTLPSLTVIVIIALLIKNFANYEVVKHAFGGVRLAVGGLILDTVYKMTRRLFKKDDILAAVGRTGAGVSVAIKNLVMILIFIASFVLSAIFQMNPVLIVSLAGICGLIFLSDILKTIFPKRDAGKS
jgi:chromate transporter